MRKRLSQKDAWSTEKMKAGSVIDLPFVFGLHQEMNLYFRRQDWFILLVLWAWIAFPSQAAAKQSPNILFIIADDLGYRDVGCFGAKEIKTPNLDQLASEGVRATSFYVSWPACTPSRASILTGRFPQRNGLYDMIRNDMTDYGHRYTQEDYPFSPEMTLGMDLREITIGQVLQKAGYTTGVIGKWDGGRAKRFLPLQRGFHFFYGFANTGIDYWTHERYGVPSMMRGNDDIKEKGYATDLFRREAVQFLRDHQRHPFFLYLAFNAPHSASNLEKDSYQAPENFLALYPDEKNKSTDPRRKYMAMISSMDAAIGELLDTLKQLKLDENTLVIFTSDNGGAGVGDNAPLRGKKGETWEGGIRVPFIARWPGKIPAGTTIDDFLTTLEIFPTLVSIAKARSPKNVTLDGFNFLPVLEGKVKSSRTEMFWERRQFKGARCENYKWVEMGKKTGLFDLSMDIGEQHDLSADKPEVLQKIKARFDHWKKEMDAAEPRGPFKNY